MAAEAAGLAIGFLGTALTSISFLKDLIPEAPEPESKGATVAVKIGGYDLGAERGAGLAGDLSRVFAWDHGNVYLGQAKGAKMSRGDSQQFTIDSSDPGDQADYVGLSAGDDNICVAWITVTQYNDKDASGAWTGDIGYACGQDWYPQDQWASDHAKTKSHKYYPKCTWLDSDHSALGSMSKNESQPHQHIPAAAMKFKVGAYGTNPSKTDVKNACKFTSFDKYSEPISEQPGGEYDKRGTKKRRSPGMEKHLVISKIEEHKATEVCESETSRGPDFVAPDGYCDMDSHTFYPLCSKEKVHGCVNVDSDGKKVSKVSLVAKREVEGTHRAYEKVETWGEE